MNKYTLKVFKPFTISSGCPALPDEKADKIFQEFLKHAEIWDQSKTNASNSTNTVKANFKLPSALKWYKICCYFEETRVKSYKEDEKSNICLYSRA